MRRAQPPLRVNTGTVVVDIDYADIYPGDNLNEGCRKSASDKRSGLRIPQRMRPAKEGIL